VSPFRALIAGVSAVLRAPLLVTLVTVVTVGAAIPFALALGTELRESLSNQPPISLDATEIDAEWWLEFRAHARGLARTFTPAIIGFAAPLDNLSAILDGTRRPLALVAPVVLFAATWSFLLGGLLTRFARGTKATGREFLAACRRHFVAFAGISLAAAGAVLLLYVTVHPLLFGAVYPALSAQAATEQAAFFWRVALYIVFGGLLVGISLVADYARISLVSERVAGLRQAAIAGARFVWGQPSAVISLYLLTGTLFVLLLAVYGVADRRLGGWRAVAGGQAYIVARIVLRLAGAAAEIKLYQSRHAAQIVSRADVNPGPPAAT